MGSVPRPLGATRSPPTRPSKSGPNAGGLRAVTVHRVGLFTAFVLVFFGFVFLALVGPIGLLLLVLAVVLLWYALGPGARESVAASSP